MLQHARAWHPLAPQLPPRTKLYRRSILQSSQRALAVCEECGTSPSLPTRLWPPVLRKGTCTFFYSANRSSPFLSSEIRQRSPRSQHQPGHHTCGTAPWPAHTRPRRRFWNDPIDKRAGRHCRRGRRAPGPGRHRCDPSAGATSGPRSCSCATPAPARTCTHALSVHAACRTRTAIQAANSPVCPPALTRRATPGSPPRCRWRRSRCCRRAFPASASPLASLACLTPPPSLPHE